MIFVKILQGFPDDRKLDERCCKTKTSVELLIVLLQLY